MSLTHKQSSRIDLFNSLSKEDRNLIGPIRSIDKDGVMYDGYGFPYAPGKWNYMDGDFIKEKLWNKLSTWARSKIEKYNKQSPGYKIWHEGEAEMSIQDRISELRKKGGKRRLTLKKKSKRSKKTMKKGGKPTKGDFENVEEALDFILKDYPQKELDEDSNQVNIDEEYKEKLRDFISTYIRENFNNNTFKNYTKDQLVNEINNLIFDKEKMFKLFDKHGMVNDDYGRRELYDNFLRAFNMYRHPDFYDTRPGYYGGTREDRKNTRQYKKRNDRIIHELILYMFVDNEGVVNYNYLSERMNRIEDFKDYLQGNQYIIDLSNNPHNYTTKEKIENIIQDEYNAWIGYESDNLSPITHTSSSGGSNRSYLNCIQRRINQHRGGKRTLKSSQTKRRKRLTKKAKK
jgi:hypothetical protein